MSTPYKRCSVVACRNTSIKTPGKLYFHVPMNLDMRLKWLKAAGRDPTKISSKSVIYFCEDHFDLPNDMENYLEYKLMGSVTRNYVKSHCIPSKFQGSSREETTLEDKIYKSVTHTANIPYNAAMPDSPNTDAQKDLTFGDSVNKSTQACPDTADKSLQVHSIQENNTKGIQVAMKSKFRSKLIQSKPLMVSESTSPNRAKFISVQTMTKGKPSTSGYTRQIFSEDSEAYSVTPSTSEISFLKTDSSSLVNDTEHAEFLRFEQKTKSETFNQECYALTLQKIKSNPRYYIGVQNECYYLIKLIEKWKNIPEKHILICLSKIRLNHTFTEIGNDFGMSMSYASKIFKKYVSVIAKALRQFIAKSNNIKLNLPMSFRHKYHNINHIIDALEIEIQKPLNTVHQALSWSDYKKANTLKYLISSTPDGLIDYISIGYSGRITDVTLVENCGYIDFLQPGEYILADRGFKHIEPLLLQKDIYLIRPPSVDSKSKLSKSDARKTKQIASLRIHIERVIRRVREFSLLKPHSVVNTNLIGVIDECMVIACALVNLQDSLIRSHNYE